MKLEITSRVENPLMDRTRVLFEIEQDAAEATPSRKQVRDVLTAKLGADKELLVIESIRTVRGRNSSKGIANLYKSKAAYDKLGIKYLKARDTAAPKAAKSGAAPVQKEGAQ